MQKGKNTYIYVENRVSFELGQSHIYVCVNVLGMKYDLVQQTF